MNRTSPERFASDLMIVGAQTHWDAATDPLILTHEPVSGPEPNDAGGAPSKSSPRREAPANRRRKPGSWARAGKAWVALLLLIAAIVSFAVVKGAVVPGLPLSPTRSYFTRSTSPSNPPGPERIVSVRTHHAQSRVMRRVFLAEGVVRGEQVVVPIIAVGWVTGVKAAEGDRVRKGQVLAELDPSRAEINLKAAESAVETAKAELERTKIGSNYQLRFERPRLETILLDIAKQEQTIASKMVDVEKRLQDKYYQSLFMLYTAQLEQLAANSSARQAEVTLDMATRGSAQSQKISEEAVKLASFAVQLRKSEIEECRVTAKIDGVVERTLIRQGEYNAEPGSPGFVINSGIWFEAQFDQSTLGSIRTGDEAEIRLEAVPGDPFVGKVTRIHPFVAYNLGGPEVTRPYRPEGTGAPEWPATFAVRIELDAKQNLSRALPAPGQTGSARVTLRSKSLAVPQSSVKFSSIGRGVVFLPRGSGYETREVKLGVRDREWLEIVAGLSDGDEVMTAGQEQLQKGDRIAVEPEVEKVE